MWKDWLFSPYVLLGVCLLLTLLVSGCARFNSSVVLVAPNGARLMVDERFDEKITAFLRKHATPKSNAVLYIPGRGHEPIKSRRLIIPYMQKAYEVDVWMLQWPSSPGPLFLGYPSQEAVTASGKIERVFKHFANRCHHAQVQCSLFVHSMGNIVLKNFVGTASAAFLKERLFENIILNAGDADLKDHCDWVDKILFAQRIYITHNQYDVVLGFSKYLYNGAKDRMGQYLPIEPCSQANYIDFSKETGWSFGHEYFHTNARKNGKIFDFYFEVLNGRAAKNLQETAPHCFQFS